ncbi:addiction module component [Candidatus Methylobacter oryzae]|uniref:Addiction module component n=2 Tax=Candidatus Methylobacter oryzae TaxID=2497749 RepID=A0ABY3CDX1_9GAMM|nr:addiction module component [Candidatus Methylobacter oryzae]
MNVQSFLKRNRITEADWESANIGWEELKAIGLDHHKNTSDLEAAAELLAKMLQKCNSVHSVRWRIKKPEHLMEKIIRKRVEDSEKYKSISVSDYADKVTDLIGIRAIHLFKYEWEDMHSYILESWHPTENVIAYIREGDENATADSYRKNGCEVKYHPAGYRSIHYVIPTQPGKKTFFAEIQVRTIFEEGWSEIDHKIRYPNFSNNELLSYFLAMFNRMAGSADEMGTFVKNLTTEISQQEIKAAEIKQEQEDLLSKIEALALELSKEKDKPKDNNSEKLNEEIKKLRSNSTSYSNLIDNKTSLLGSASALSAMTVADHLKATTSVSDLLNKHGANLSGSASALSAMTAADQLDAVTRMSELLNKHGASLSGSASAITAADHWKATTSMSDLLNKHGASLSGSASAMTAADQLNALTPVSDLVNNHRAGLFGGKKKPRND